jgi:hypothetical protein
VEHDTSGQLRGLAERLGRLGCGPRDVTDVHTAALRTVSASATHEQVRAYISEGRLSALELMGYLVSFYRNKAIGGPWATSASAAGQEEAER